MRFFHLRRFRSLVSRSHRYPLYALGALAILLAGTLCVVSLLKAHTEYQVGLSRSHLRQSIQSDLTMLLRTYEQINVPRVDVENSVLPTMRTHLYSAYTLDNVLSSVHGAEESMIGNEFYSNMSAALDQLSREISSGQRVDYTVNPLSEHMAEIQSVLAQDFHGGASPLA